MNEVKVSVIIPVYNTAGYLRQCVDSVLTQSYLNYEIILVDDESPDEAPDICDEYAKLFEQIVVVHKKNGGSSDARNAGIKVASGQYVLFMDSDDFWNDTNALQNIVSRLKLTEPDVLNYSYVKYYEESNTYIPQFENIPAMNKKIESKTEQLDYIVGNYLYIASACNKAIKRSLLTDDMYFTKGNFSEDIEWCVRLLKKAISMDFICENFYCYRQREGSTSHSLVEKSCIDLALNIQTCVRLAKNSAQDMKRYIYIYSAYQYSTFFAVQAMAVSCPKEIMLKMSKYKWLLRYHGSNKKVTCLYVGCKLVGFRNLCWIVRKTKKIWSR